MQSGDVQAAHGLKIPVIQEKSRVISHWQTGDFTDFYSQLLEAVSVVNISFFTWIWCVSGAVSEVHSL